MKVSTTTAIIAALATFGMVPSASQAMSDDEAKIEALENSFTAAFNAKDVDAIMKVYVPDASLVVFDIVPPRQYLGADAYRKDWQEFFGLFKGPVKFLDHRPARRGRRHPRLQPLHPTCQRDGHERATDRAGRAGH